MQEKRIVISKDADFFNRYFRVLEPHKLIFLTTGNINTEELLQLFDRNLELILKEIEVNFIVEITRKAIITID